MKPELRERLIGLALVVLIGLLMGFGLTPAGVRLPDGRRLRVLAVTVGPQHTFRTGDRYERPPFSWLPTGFRDRLGWQQYSVSTRVVDDASLVLWFTGFDSGTGSERPPTFARIEVMDAAGGLVARAGQAKVPALNRSLGLALFPGLTNFPVGARLRFFSGAPAGDFVELDPPAISP